LQCWEKGIPLCKELADLYERRLFDYAKLSQILQTQAKFFDNILTQLRPEPEYFRVGFYGLSFPLFVRVSCIFMLCAVCNSKLKIEPNI
jgi:dedicator of cytokinesis protein 3